MSSEELELRPLAPVVDIATKRGKYCGHRCKRTVCPEDRTVTCTACGALLDPVDALVDVAREWEIRVSRDKELDRQIERKEARLMELTRLERNTATRLRRRGLI